MGLFSSSRPRIEVESYAVLAARREDIEGHDVKIRPYGKLVILPAETDGYEFKQVVSALKKQVA